MENKLYVRVVHLLLDIVKNKRPEEKEAREILRQMGFPEIK